MSDLESVWASLKKAHNYRAEDIRKLSKSDWQELVRRIRKRLPRTIATEASSAEKLNSSRFLRQLRRKLVHKGKGIYRPTLQRAALLWKKKPCTVLDAFFPQREVRWIEPVKRREVTEISLINFSLLDHPKETFIQLHQIAKAEALSRDLYVNFLEEYCADISAYLVLGVMRQNMAPIVRGGQIRSVVRSMMDAADLSQFFHMSHLEPEKEQFKFWAFPVRYRHKTGTSTSQDVAYQPSAKEKLSDDLVGKLDSWLASRKRQSLTDTQKMSVANMISEILDNAERHSDLNDRDGDWAIAGFSSSTVFKMEDGTEHKCDLVTLATVSIGASIAQSMAACEDPETVNLIEEYVRLHGKNYPRSTLVTVYALQDRISRFRQDDHRSKGGIGMLDMVQFANDMSEIEVEGMEPRLTLISGDVCVMIRPPYGNAPPAASMARRLWFNPTNSHDIQPAKSHVFTLPYEFPGTIVATRFCLTSRDAHQGMHCDGT